MGLAIQDSTARTLPYPRDAEAVTDSLLHHMRDIPFIWNPVIPLSPVMLPRQIYGELFSATRLILDLLKRTLKTLGGTSTERLHALKDDAGLRPFFVADAIEDRYVDTMARPDVILSPDGLRFIEFNVGGAVGGAVHAHLLLHAWRELYTAEFGQPGFVGSDPFAARASLFRRACRDLDRAPAAAILGSTRDLIIDSPRYFDVEVSYLRRHGIEACFVEPEELGAAVGPVPGWPAFPVALRHFMVSEWREHGIDLSPVREAVDAGMLLLGPESSYLLSNNQVLALLSEGPGWLTAPERALVERYIPWSRLVADREVEFEGTSQELVPLLLSRQEHLVLKGGTGFAASGVILGRHTPPGEWAAAVDLAVREGSWIAQEFTESVRVPLPMRDSGNGDIETLSVEPILSPYVFDGKPGGCMVRHNIKGTGHVVSVTGGSSVLNIAAGSG